VLVISVLRLLGYAWGALRVLWHLKGNLVKLLILASDAANAWTDRCLTPVEWQKLSIDIWCVLETAGLTCDHSAVQANSFADAANDFGGTPSTDGPMPVKRETAALERPAVTHWAEWNGGPHPWDPE
jgi:hypothetical protein